MGIKWGRDLVPYLAQIGVSHDHGQDAITIRVDADGEPIAIGRWHALSALQGADNSGVVVLHPLVGFL
jgi:hypothetical protein